MGWALDWDILAFFSTPWYDVAVKNESLENPKRNLMSLLYSTHPDLQNESSFIGAPGNESSKTFFPSKILFAVAYHWKADLQFSPFFPSLMKYFSSIATLMKMKQTVMFFVKTKMSKNILEFSMILFMAFTWHVQKCTVFEKCLKMSHSILGF